MTCAFEEKEMNSMMGREKVLRAPHDMTRGALEPITTERRGSPSLCGNKLLVLMHHVAMHMLHFILL